MGGQGSAPLSTALSSRDRRFWLGHCWHLPRSRARLCREVVVDTPLYRGRIGVWGDWRQRAIDFVHGDTGSLPGQEGWALVPPWPLPAADGLRAPAGKRHRE